jgi:hypothetical protein
MLTPRPTSRWHSSFSKNIGEAMELYAEHLRKQMDSFLGHLEDIRYLTFRIIEDQPTGISETIAASSPHKTKFRPAHHRQ